MKMFRVFGGFAISCVFLCVLVTAIPLDDESSSSTTTTTTITTTIATDSSTASTTTTAATTTASETSATPINNPPAEQKYLTAADDVPICKESNADLGACVQRIFEIMLPRMKDGIKELNIPALDPFVLNRTTLQAALGPVTGRVTMKRGLVYGFSALKYKKVDVQLKGDQIKLVVNAHAPKINIVGSYKGDIAVNNNNNAHMRPKGTFNITLFDVNMKIWSDSVLYEKDGHRFVRLIKFDADPKVGDMKINVTGIFEEPQLNEIVVNVLNQYWRDIYAAVLPETRNYWAPMVLRAANEAMTVVPFDLYVKNE